MAQAFKEVAMLRGADKKFENNYNQIDWDSSKNTLNPLHDYEREPVKNILDEVKLSREEIIDLVKYCLPHCELMWSASILGKILRCDFRDSKSKAIEFLDRYNVDDSKINP